MTPTGSIHTSGIRRLVLVGAVDERCELYEFALQFAGYEVHWASECSVALLSTTLIAKDPDLVIWTFTEISDPRFAVYRRLTDQQLKWAELVLAPHTFGDHLRRDGGRDLTHLETPVDLHRLVDEVRKIISPGSRHLIQAGVLRLDLIAQLVSVGGDEVALTVTEARLLKILMTNADQVVSKRVLIDEVWQYDFGGRTNMVETYVSYLRKKLPPESPRIVTIRGEGYMLSL